MGETSTSSALASAEQEELAAYYRELADLYRFYGGALVKELSTDQIDILAQGEFSQESTDEEEAEGLRWMRSYLAHRGSDPRTDLAVDYARVFLAAGIFEGDTAVPYESVYLSEEGILMQEPRDEVVLAYRAYGYQVDPDLQTPEDHAGFELEFMAMLSDRIADAIEAGVDCSEDVSAQSAFIDAHILSWFPMLRDRVDKFAEYRFYPALMRMIIGAVRENRSVNSTIVS